MVVGAQKNRLRERERERERERDGVLIYSVLTLTIGDMFGKTI